MKYQDEIQLCDGPPLAEGGFFYEMFLQNERTISTSDFDELNGLIKTIIKQKQPFQRLKVTREEAKQVFSDNPLKLEMLEKIPPDETITLYRCGQFVDMCRGPHISHTGKLFSI